jgi:flagellar hook-associated protein 3 FlgL
MRITDQMMTSEMLRHIDAAFQKYAKSSLALTSEKRFQRPSEDPMGAQTYQQIEAELQNNQRYQQNIQSATSELDIADSALGQATNIMTRAKTIALKMSSSSYNQNDRLADAKELRQMRDELKSVANTRVGDRYIFGGFKDRQPPVPEPAKPGDPLKFQGDTKIRRIEIGPDMYQEVSVSGDIAFGAGGKNANPFDSLDKVINALEKNESVDNVQQIIGEFDDASTDIIESRAQVGANINSLSSSLQVAENFEMFLSDWRRNVIEVDVAKAATDISSAQQALEASLATTQKAMGLSMLKYLG